jgi:hypothetical protein
MVAIGIRTAPELAGMVMQAIVLGKLNQIPLGFGIIPFSLLARFLVDQRELVPVLAMRLTSRFSLLSITARWRGRAAIFFRDSFLNKDRPYLALRESVRGGYSQGSRRGTKAN